jgi:hypothetical protein
LRAAELSIMASCVGEALSVPALAGSRERVDGPLVRAVLDRLLRDEGPHARVGGWFLEWCAERLSMHDRQHLAGVALDAIEVYAPLWRDRCRSCELAPAFGGLPARSHAELLVQAVRTRVAAPLEALGFAIRGERLEALLS